MKAKKDITHANIFPKSEKKSVNTIINREYQVLKPEFFRKSSEAKKNRLSYKTSSSLNENSNLTINTNCVHSDRISKEKETYEIGIQTEVNQKQNLMNACNPTGMTTCNPTGMNSCNPTGINTCDKSYLSSNVSITGNNPNHIDNLYLIRDNLVANFNAFAVGLKQLGLASSDGSLPLNNSINSQNCSASYFGNLSNIKENQNPANSAYNLNVCNTRPVNINLNSTSLMNESVQTISIQNQNSLNASAEKNCNRTKSLENQNRVNSDSLRYKSLANNYNLLYENCTIESKSVAVDTNDRTDDETNTEIIQNGKIKETSTDTVDLSDFCKSHQDSQRVTENNPSSETNESPNKNSNCQGKIIAKDSTDMTLTSDNNPTPDTWRKADSVDKGEFNLHIQNSNDDFKKNSPYFKYVNEG